MQKTKPSSISQTMQDAINDQIQAELESAYLYLALAARMEQLNLKGFAHWLRLQWQEETQHALKFYDYLLQRDGVVRLKALPTPAYEAETPLEIFELVLEHEQYITRRINDLYALSNKERDYASQTLLQWFVDEQIEEEESARDIIDDLRLVGDSGASLFLLDRELAQRQAEEEEE
ncbi:MAG: ferritin [Bacteroidetes bacterium SB0662_bin_6]|nr:ferritin [Bacteroidetes bacterium SB0668_bin_1]MYE03792.1 ferritin [Bacteroidetes bacterium SB0662_bin_6]